MTFSELGRVGVQSVCARCERELERVFVTTSRRTVEEERPGPSALTGKSGGAAMYCLLPTHLPILHLHTHRCYFSR
jgi:hypothetical protein